MAQFLRELCTRAQRSTVYTAGQKQEFFAVTLGPSGMDILRAAADTIERAPADRGAEVAALEQRTTDLSVQLARAFALIAGAASTLEDIAGGQPLTVAQARASHLREALALAQSSGLIDTPTATRAPSSRTAKKFLADEQAGRASGRPSAPLIP